MKDIRQKLLATFQIEHRDHVEQIRSLLAMIEKTAAPATGPELEEVFRRAHSLKGAARAVDLRAVEGLAHRMETLFSRVRKGVLLLDKNVSGVVHQALDASEDCVMALGEERPATGFRSALSALERVLGMESELPSAPAPEADTSVPAFQPLEVVRITVRNFDGMLRSAGGILTESRHQTQITQELNGIVRGIANLRKESERSRKSTAATRGTESHREVSRLTAHLDSMEQQMRVVSRQTLALKRLQQRSSWSMQNLGKQLQRDVWQARMAPAESLLEGLRKIVRDLARDEGKEIECHGTSSGVQADRRVLEALKDPLMHLLRNAVSHGIEAPQERVAKGKSPSGVLTVRIDSSGQRLTITIQDDGKGVDFNRVREVAVRQGLLNELAAAQSAPHELARILFQPGFSTSKSVTHLSGRGMGLSVVYETIRHLQGELDLSSADEGGTVIQLSVPLSISTHRLLLAKCAHQILAIPIHGVERLYRIRADRVETLEGKPVMMLSGQPMPLLSLHQWLGLEEKVATRSDILQVMILRSGAKRAAVVVDGFLWEIDAVIQDLGPIAGRDKKISSAILLEDGSAAFVLNPMQLLDGAMRSQNLFIPQGPEPAPQKARSTILVVDDSLTTRTLEKSILEANGYRVRAAVDGIQALELMRAEKPDLVVTDIEMPRLNGFGLLEAMKKDDKLARIPVIVVTSVDRREDQQRGLDLGADAYIVKRKFDQEELLAVIRQIL